jgi:fluoride exporter
MDRIVLVAIAGAAGSVCRYLTQLGMVAALGAGFPYGTVLVNVVGSFLIGFVAQLSLSHPAVTPLVRLTLMTGFLGGLTTYSSFSYESVILLKDGAFLPFVVNIVVTTVLALSMCAFGMWIGA